VGQEISSACKDVEDEDDVTADPTRSIEEEGKNECDYENDCWPPDTDTDTDTF
jgi:hypothetical protein